MHRLARIDRLVVSTYQSVSGAGQPGLRELDEQWTKYDGRAETLRRAGANPGAVEAGEVWDKPIAGNVIPLAGSVKEAGYTSEEWKLVYETRKILHDDEIRVSPTCVRVPVYVGHAMSANVSFHRDVSRAEAEAVLADAPGVVLVDGGDGYPTPLEAAGIDPVLVGRLREDPSQPGALEPLGHRRQPAQGRGAQRGADGRGPTRPLTIHTAKNYCRLELVLENLVETVRPSTLTATMTMIAMKAMSRMYSTRFAPRSFWPASCQRTAIHARQ